MIMERLLGSEEEFRWGNAGHTHPIQGSFDEYAARLQGCELQVLRIGKQGVGIQGE